MRGEVTEGRGLMSFWRKSILLIATISLSQLTSSQ